MEVVPKSAYVYMVEKYTYVYSGGEPRFQMYKAIIKSVENSS